MFLGEYICVYVIIIYIYSIYVCSNKYIYYNVYVYICFSEI